MLKDITVNRIYKCYNKECGAIIQVTQGCGDPFCVLCPFCETENLLLESGKASISTIMELSKPKTIGSLGEHNSAIREKREGPKPKEEVPWWRKNNKNNGRVNFKILQNPAKYISDGSI